MNDHPQTGKTTVQEAQKITFNTLKEQSINQKDKQDILKYLGIDNMIEC